MSDVRRLTPNIFVDAIEPCIPFWSDILGFEVEMSAPGEDGFVFVMLKRGNVELMYQTVASLDDDLPALVPIVAGQTYTLFVEVTGLDDIAERLEAASIEPIQPRRTTFYGADEIWVQAPCGSIVGLAEFGTQAGGGAEDGAADGAEGNE